MDRIWEMVIVFAVTCLVGIPFVIFLDKIAGPRMAKFACDLRDKIDSKFKAPK